VIGFFDVGYAEESALVGCLTADDFADCSPLNEWVIEVSPIGPYIPGEFWRRELAPLLRGIAASPSSLSVLLIDAYVDLGHDQTPGLGRRLYEVTGIPVIGVAKSRYFGTPIECEVFRGASNRALLVSVAGFDLTVAKQAVARMAGSGRVPALIRRADQLSRGSAPRP
jgi:deoxyribonuclease V